MRTGVHAMASTAPLSQRNFDAQPGAASRLGLQMETAAQMRDALFHAQQAETARMRAVEALAVIEHAQVDASAFLHHLQCARCARTACRAQLCKASCTTR